MIARRSRDRHRPPPPSPLVPVAFRAAAFVVVVAWMHPRAAASAAFVSRAAASPSRFAAGFSLRIAPSRPSVLFRGNFAAPPPLGRGARAMPSSSPRAKRPRTSLPSSSSSANDADDGGAAMCGGGDRGGGGGGGRGGEPSPRPLVVVLAGPTGVGKSAVAASLCRPSRAARLLARGFPDLGFGRGDGDGDDSHGDAVEEGVGHVVSADSVQAYRGVRIGANKPTDEERNETPHHLIDVVDANDTYNAANWMEDALCVVDRLSGNTAATAGGEEDGDDDEETRRRRGRIAGGIDAALRRRSSTSGGGGGEAADVSSDAKSAVDRRRPVLPVVVGGTMMYLQWLVHGRPDAPRPSPGGLKKAAEVLAEFRAMDEVEDEEIAAPGEKAEGGDPTAEPSSTKGWDAACKHASSLGAPFESRVQKLCGRDWYRLRRILEVAYTVLGDENDDSNGKEDGNRGDGGSAVAAAATTEERVDALYTGLRSGGLNSGRGRNYDVRCFFLCPDDRMNHAAEVDKRCESMLSKGLLRETADLSLSGQLPDDGQAARAIGYRQALEYLRRTPVNDGEEEDEDEAAAFDRFVDDFASVTRRYAKKQMQWFRKDDSFAFVPVKLSDPAGRRVDDAADAVLNMCLLPRDEYENEIRSVGLPKGKEKGSGGGGGKKKGKYDDLLVDESTLTMSQRTKLANERQGKGMKLFMAKRHTLVRGSEEYANVLKEAKECTARMRDSPPGTVSS